MRFIKLLSLLMIFIITGCQVQPILETPTRLPAPQTLTAPSETSNPPTLSPTQIPPSPTPTSTPLPLLTATTIPMPSPTALPLRYDDIIHGQLCCDPGRYSIISTPTGAWFYALKRRYMVSGTR